MQHGCRIAAVIEGQRTKISYSEDPKTGANDRLRIVEGTVGEGEARLEVALISVAQRLRQVILAGGDVVSAR